MRDKKMSVNPNTLWMGDLQPHMDERFLMWAFNQMGQIVVCVKLIRDRQTGAPAGYCFVEFPDAESAGNALLKLNGKAIPGSKPYKLFKLNHASFGREHLQIPEYSLYVGELTPDVDDLALYNTFSKRYKSIRAAKVVLDEATNRNKGFGFVRFTSQEEQQLALIEMQYFNGLGGKPIRVSLAVPKMLKKGARPATTVPVNPPIGPALPTQVTAPYSHVAPPAAAEVYGAHNYYHQTPQQYQTQHPQLPSTQYWSGEYSTQYYAYVPGVDYNTDPSQQYQTGSDPYYDPDDEALEDPQLEIDVEQANKDFMERSEELYVALEGSRWHPLDNVFSKIIPSSSHT